METITFTNKSNANRAAKKAVERGTAEGPSYTIETVEGGFQIVWAKPVEEAPVEAKTKRPRAAKKATEPKVRRSAQADADAAAGTMPGKPVITSAANPGYQKKFDALAALADAGDWAGVEAYQVTGVNTYAKKLGQYRARLLAAHAAQSATSAAA